MDESTIAAIVIGCIVVALAALSSYMAARERDREEVRKKKQPRRLPALRRRVPP